jgi:hypothetical protein
MYPIKEIRPYGGIRISLFVRDNSAISKGAIKTRNITSQRLVINAITRCDRKDVFRDK